MDRRPVQLLERRAQAHGSSASAVVRELFGRHPGDRTRVSRHDQWKELCGSVSGPGDLSARKLKGYGRD
jgi:hypothetical protein